MSAVRRLPGTIQARAVLPAEQTNATRGSAPAAVRLADPVRRTALALKLQQRHCPARGIRDTSHSHHIHIAHGGPARAATHDAMATPAARRIRSPAPDSTSSASISTAAATASARTVRHRTRACRSGCSSMRRASRGGGHVAPRERPARQRRHRTRSFSGRGRHASS